VDPNQTRLAPALQLALARAAQFGGLVIRTDGQFTDADWQALAGAVGRAGLPVAVVPMESTPSDARIVQLSAERQAGPAVRVEVTVAANALDRRTLTVRRTRPPAAAPLLARQLDLLPGQPATFRLDDTPPDAGLAAYSAQLSPGDAFAENDAAEAMVLPSRRRVALVAGPQVADPAAWSARLAAALGMPVQPVAPAAAPRTADGWAEYAAVVLVDQQGTALPAAARAAVEQYVRQGGGLVLVGAGPHADSADRDDPLNRAAALLANPYERKPLRVVVVLDASGSMAEPADSPGATPGRIKFDQAGEAVLSLRRHLTPADSLAVITFCDSAQEIYSSGQRPIDFAAVAETLRAVRPAGPTDIVPALTLAAATPAAEGRDTLVLAVSDLLTKPFRADQMAGLFRRQKISLAVAAVVAPGPDASAPAGTSQPGGASPLATLADLLGAPVVRCEGLNSLAEVFARFLRANRPEAIRRGKFPALPAGSVFGRSAPVMPQVQAYLLCAPQPRADVLAHVGGEGDPLLAVRRVGLGRSASLALPAAPADNPDWQGQGGLADWTAAAAKWALRPGNDGRFTGLARREGDRLVLQLHAQDANGPVNMLDLTASVCWLDQADGGAAPEQLPVRQIAPGRYEAATKAGAGPAGLTVQLAGGAVVWESAVAKSAPRELSEIGPNWPNLRLLAQLTGGRIAPTQSAGDLALRLAAAGKTDLWPFLLAAAAALMLVDWAISRIWHRKA
jgi:hypothetical protein